MNEQVAIIVPVYNSSRFLSECIESIIAQTYKNIEIILVDDGSKDNSLEIIEHYAQIDVRIKYVSIINQGVSNARNVGVMMAQSEKVVFVDSDDTVDRNLIEALITQAADVDFVMCGYENYDEKRMKKQKYPCPEFFGDINSFCNTIMDFLTPPFILGPCFKLFDKRIIDKWHIVFPVDISFGEDAEFVLSYLEHVKSVRCVSMVGYTYRQHDSGTLSRKLRTDKMDIYRRINQHILRLVSAHKATKCVPELHKRYIQNYVEYSRELFLSKLKYSEKRKLFINKGEGNCVLESVDGSRRLSLAQKLVLFALRIKVVFPTYVIFFIKEKFAKR